MQREKSMKNIIQPGHPLIKTLVTRLRDLETESYTFRKTLSELARLLLYEALKDEKTEEINIKLWSGSGNFPYIKGERYVFIPVLRAGLPMLDGVLEAVPEASAGFLAIKRDEKTLKSTVYYDRVPPLKGKTAFILDPMVATGGSLDHAISVVKGKKPDRIFTLNVIGAPDGVRRVCENHPDITMVIAQVDEKLDNNGYILPGLGDAGDRAFNT